MKVKTKKNNHYPGDKSIAIQYQNANGIYQTFFNIWKERGYYNNDRFSNQFNTITEAKEFALNKLIKELTN